MTAIESIIEILSANENDYLKKEIVIEVLKAGLPLEKLLIDTAELRGSIKATIEMNSQHKTT